MERDAGISHGASSFVNERLMKASDGYRAIFCRTCGSFAINDGKLDTYKCRLCGDSGNFGRYTFPYALKLLIHYMGAMGINLRFDFVTSKEFTDLLFQTEEEFSGDIGDIITGLNETDYAEAEDDTGQEEAMDDDFPDLGDHI
jgi:hypothetical protein